MQGFNIIGVQNTTGMGNAFSMHSRALLALRDGDIRGVTDGIVEDYENLYYHGPPKWTDDVLRGVNAPGKKVAYWVWESSKLPKTFHQHHFKFDEIWTASHYCQHILESCLKREVKVVPHGIESFYYRPEIEGTPTILVTFDGGSKILRKNPQFAVKTFAAAFGDTTSVKLVVKGRNVGKSIRDWLRRLAGGSNVEFVYGDIPQVDMNRLYWQSDVLYSPHCSEGFGLPLLEAMGRGKVVVATKHGGNLEFMSDKNSFLIDSEDVPVNDDLYAGEWGEPDFDDAVDKLRASLGDTREMREKAFHQALKHHSFTSVVEATNRALG